MARIERSQIRALMQRSRSYGDKIMADLCDRALDGEEEAWQACAAAVATVEEMAEDEYDFDR